METREKWMMPTLTSSKALVVAAATVFLLSPALAPHNEDTGRITDEKLENYSVPQYESHGELLTQLVAPYLLIALLFQLGLQTALEATLLRRTYRYQNRYKKKKRIKKHSTVMALAIAGMLIPSPFFKYINQWVTILFGSIGWLWLLLVFIIFLGVMLTALTENGGHE